MSNANSLFSRIVEKNRMWKMRLLADLDRENKRIIDSPADIVRPALKASLTRTTYNAVSNQTIAFYLVASILVISFSASKDITQFHNSLIFCVVAILSGLVYCFLINVPVSAALSILRAGTFWNYLISGALTSSAAGATTFFIVSRISNVESVMSLGSTLAYFWALFLVWLVVFYNRHQGNLFPVADPKRDKPNGLVMKLPFSKRGKILYLQAMEHYVNVATDKGEHLLRIKFGEAISFLEQNEGLKIHRSFWVCNDLVDYPFREGRRWRMKVDGKVFPVSLDNVEKAVARVEAVRAQRPAP